MRRPLALVVTAALTAGAFLAVAVPVRTAHAAPVDIVDPRPGPLGPVSVIGDSVLMGAGLYAPTLPTRLVEQGWGPIRFRAGEGYSTGYFPVPASFKASEYIRQWRAAGWDAPNVIVNLGANDSGFCTTSSACARAAILHLVDAIGPDRQIWWPQITRFYTHYETQEAWNSALRQIAAERPNFHTWDWPAEMRSGGYRSHDMIHLDPDSYRKRSQVMAEVFTQTVARARRVGPDAVLPEAVGAPSRYLPVTPTRVLDTRRQDPGRLPAGGTATIDLSDWVPDDTTAVAVQLTAAGPAAPGHLTARPCGTPLPRDSNVNYPAGTNRGAMSIVPVDDRHRLCVTTHADTDLVIDLQGAFVTTTPASTLTPLTTPTRLLDTRRTGRATRHRIDIPTTSTAAAVNITAVNATQPGHLTATPSDTVIPTSTTNQICITSTTRNVDVIVDLTGTFHTGTGLRFTPVTPTRLHDTRTGTGGWAPIHGADQTLDIRTTPTTARAVTGTLTLAAPTATTHLTAWACTTRPTTSNVNATTADNTANSITTAVTTTGRLCLHTPRTTHTIFDVTGWWTP